MLDHRKTLRGATLAAVAALLVAATLVATSSLVQAADKVRIAVNGPLTGPISLVFNDYTKGLQMGLDDAAKELGVSRDIFELDLQDNAGNPRDAISAAKKHLLGKVDVYLSGYSAISKAIAPEIDKAGIPHFMVAFDAFLAGEDPNRLRIFPHYKLEGPVYVDYIKQHGAKKVAILALNFAAIDEEFAMLVEPAFKGTDVKFMREMYDFNIKDYNTLVLKAAKFKPDLTIINGFALHVYPLLKAVRTYVRTGSVLATMSFITILYEDKPTEELAGTIFTAPHYTLPGVTKGADAWNKAYKARFNTTPHYVPAYAYDTARMIVAAYKKSGKVTTQTLRGVTPFAGLVGSIELDADGDIIGSLGIGQVNPDRSVKVLRK